MSDDYFFAEGVKTTQSNRLNFSFSFRPISKGTAKNEFSLYRLSLAWISGLLSL